MKHLEKYQSQVLGRQRANAWPHSAQVICTILFGALRPEAMRLQCFDESQRFILFRDCDKIEGCAGTELFVRKPSHDRAMQRKQLTILESLESRQSSNKILKQLMPLISTVLSNFSHTVYTMPASAQRQVPTQQVVLFHEGINYFANILREL